MTDDLPALGADRGRVLGMASPRLFPSPRLRRAQRRGRDHGPAWTITPRLTLITRARYTNDRWADCIIHTFPHRASLRG